MRLKVTTSSQLLWWLWRVLHKIEHFLKNIPIIIKNQLVAIIIISFGGGDLSIVQP
jgi:hypothetical protein